jgi:hypothetical protein
MKKTILYLLGIVLFFSCYGQNQGLNNDKVRAIHLLNYNNDEALLNLGKKLPKLQEMGINMLFLEVDYNFNFKSHRELRNTDNMISRTGAKRISKLCKKYGIRLVPQFQCFGHQSWAENTGPLLTTYPGLDITPNAFPKNEGIYCREWDPTNPRVHEIIFPMIDEIVDAFDADGIHVGMDEIFLIGHEKSPNTKGMDPAKVFADEVNAFHTYFVKEKGLEMFIWGDRLIDGKKYSYGEWESSMNGTAPAIDMIPKDIVICDWHYEPRESYPSVDLFLDKGFKVLPCSWEKPEAVRNLIKYSYQIDNPKMLGHLFTTWSLKPNELMDFKALQAGIELMNSKKFYDVEIQKEKTLKDGFLVVLETSNPELSIYYTTDGSTPTKDSQRYESPFIIKKSGTIQALAFRKEKEAGDVTTLDLNLHKGIGANIELNNPISEQYAASEGPRTLINGLEGSESYADPQWCGFDGKALDATLRFDSAKAIRSVSFHYIHAPESWVFGPQDITIFGKTTLDGDENKLTHSTITNPEKPGKHSFVTSLPKGNYAELRVVIVPTTMPQDHQGAGKKAWVFVDEIILQ